MFLPTSVSVDVGSVNVAAPFNMVPIFGAVKVLLVRVSIPVSVTKVALVRAVLNSAIVPVRVLSARLIDLLVKMSVVFFPTSVSVDVGNVTVLAPPLVLIDAIVGVIIVGDVSNTKLPVPVAPVDVTPSMVG